MTEERSEKQDKIMFQYFMKHKPYRVQMLIMRISITLVVAGGCFAACAASIALGIALGVTACSVGAIFIVTALGNEQTYSVYDDRIVLKVRGKDRRMIVPLENVTAVKYKRAFYEKNYATGTVTITAKNEKGRTKKYKMRHIFDAAPAVDFIKEYIANKEKHTDEN